MGKLFERIGSDPANLRIDPKFDGLARGGIQVFTKTMRNGKQIWVQVRGGDITDAGINVPGLLR